MLLVSFPGCSFQHAIAILCLCWLGVRHQKKPDPISMDHLLTFVEIEGRTFDSVTNGISILTMKGMYRRFFYLNFRSSFELFLFLSIDPLQRQTRSGWLILLLCFICYTHSRGCWPLQAALFQRLTGWKI
uniref:Uncharacterized protein n=1 Tax=Opuntia streptacantha TaxID=393608 RepID=A0A7C9FAQ4_OPUST